MVDLAASETIVAEPLAGTQTSPDQQSTGKSTSQLMVIPTDCRTVAGIAVCCVPMAMAVIPVALTLARLRRRMCGLVARQRQTIRDGHGDSWRCRSTCGETNHTIWFNAPVIVVNQVGLKGGMKDLEVRK